MRSEDLTMTTYQNGDSTKEYFTNETLKGEQ